jgi:hypothetical protein
MSEVRLFPLEGASREDEAVRRWFADPVSATRAEARRWFDAWRGCGPDVHEVLHDGHPTACVQGVALGYVNAFTDHVNVGFYLGATLDDPAGLLEGSGRFMRHVKVRPGEGRDDEALRALMRAAYSELKERLAAGAGAI